MDRLSRQTHGPSFGPVQGLGAIPQGNSPLEQAAPFGRAKLVHQGLETGAPFIAGLTVDDSHRRSVPQAYTVSLCRTTHHGCAFSGAEPCHPLGANCTRARGPA